MLRRTNRSSKIFSLDSTVVNLESRVVTVNDSEIELTLREYELLEILINNINIALSREKLLKLAGSTIILERQEPSMYIFKSCAKNSTGKTE